MENNFTNQKELVVTEIIISNLMEIAKWARFLAIVSFIGLGFIVLLGFFMGALMSSLGSLAGYGSGFTTFGALGGAFFVIFYLIIAIIGFFPAKYLFDFSKKAKQALEIKDQHLFTESIIKLKSYYKYIGIFTIVIISIYALVFVVSLFGGLIGLLFS